MTKHGKKYNAAAAKVDIDKIYSAKDAVALAKETSITKFDATIEVHLRTALDSRQADQQLRDVVVLPNGLGKTVRVLVFSQGEGAAAARAAGADLVADDDETLKKLEAGSLDFDVAIATPDAMGKVGRLGRVLGPRGLMPNPKAGTVVPAQDMERAIKEAKAGRVEFRLDKTNNIHVMIGKASFSAEKLYENYVALMDAINKARPAGAKGGFIKKITVASTMGPGVKADPSEHIEGVE
ncbi:MAG: 50S ribosomal protein L1 [Anaerolineales bacterium]|nr:50S ribosomal protein L1 [Anaerolineales bacterium]